MGRHAYLDMGASNTPTSWTLWCRWLPRRAKCRAANWMLRRMTVQMVLDDPVYANGSYTQAAALDGANGRGPSTGSPPAAGRLALQACRRPTRADADDIVDSRLFGGPADANDFRLRVAVVGPISIRRLGLKDIKAVRCWPSTRPTDERKPAGNRHHGPGPLKTDPDRQAVPDPGQRRQPRGHATTGDASFSGSLHSGAFLARTAPHRGPVARRLENR